MMLLWALGKTLLIIDMINKSLMSQKYIFITPLLTECHRIAGTVYDPEDPYKRPIVINSDDTSVLYQYRDQDTPLRNRMFKHPYFSRNGGKAESLPVLLGNNDNIVTTHQLFVNLTPEILNKAKDYILVIDEMLSIYELYTDFNKKEIDAMFRNKWISLTEDGITLQFHRENYSGNIEDHVDPTNNTYYETFATLCDLGQLLLIDDKVVIWELAANTLKSFKEVWIATYLFEDNIMSSYFKAHDIQYETVKFGKKPSDIKHLINVYEDSPRSRLNTIGIKFNALSATNCKNSEVKDILSSNLDNYIKNKAKCKKSELLWTCFKDAKPRVQKFGNNIYSNEWLAANTKATNEYKDKNTLAYLCNIFPNPELVKASSCRGYTINEEIYALSEMVQWIWRSAIREGKEINLYVPSSRMRTLLYRWLNNEFN